MDASPRAQQKLLKTIGEAYRKAPYYQQVFPLVEQVVTNGETDLGKYLYDSFRIIGGYLGIGTELILSSRMEKDCSLRAHEKVISICKLLGRHGVLQLRQRRAAVRAAPGSVRGSGAGTQLPCHASDRISAVQE